MATPILGTDGADTLTGNAGSDLLQGFAATSLAGVVIEATRIVSGLAQTLFLTAPPGDPDRLVIVQKGGVAVKVDANSFEIRGNNFHFLNIPGEISTAGELGLLGVAFHPDHARNRLVYVSMTNLAGDNEIREYRVYDGDPDRVDPATARTIITIDQPATANHRGGWIGFGPDGMLHAAIGDGGTGGQAIPAGQHPETLNGGIIRIDIDRDDFAGDSSRNYGIPADNPFVGAPGADELYAHGLRNPWRASFDRGDGTLFIGDVGQNRWEEVNIAQAGVNFGWPLFEGPDPYLAGGDPVGLTFAAHTYGRDVGSSITGGYAYRGPVQSLHGYYFFADFVSGRVFARAPDGTVTEVTGAISADVGGAPNPSSFGEDAEGNLYLLDYNGSIFRLTPRATETDGADRLSGAAGDDVAYAGLGNDILSGGSGDDALYGMAGADWVQGGTGDDTLWGGAGNDQMLGEAGSDAVNGGAGDDILNGGTGADRLNGGDGEDWVSYAGSRTGISISLLTRTALGGDAQGDSFTAVENLRGGEQADFMSGDDAANRIESRGGNDILLGLGGADRLTGGTGGDLFRFLALTDSPVAAQDTIVDFVPGADVIDLSALLDGAAAFAFAGVMTGSAIFAGGGVAQVLVLRGGPGTFVMADTGDGIADLSIRLNNNAIPLASDLIL